MTRESVLHASHSTRAYCTRTKLWLAVLMMQADEHIQLVSEATARVTAEIDTAGDVDAVRTADWRAARNLLMKMSASLEHVRLNLRIACDATDGLDHRAAIVLALDLSDTLPWTEVPR
jgi:hypothetical protein